MAAEEPKIFGKFDRYEPHKLRAWESYLGIGLVRVLGNQSTTRYRNLLHHLRRFTQSTSTQEERLSENTLSVL